MGTPTTLDFHREQVIDQHGGVGIKMSFVCDLLENIETLQKHKTKAFCQEEKLFINTDIFFELVRNLDVYVFELYSILDYLAVELSEVYGLKVKRRGREKAGAKQVEYFMELVRAENLQIDKRRMVEDLIKQPWFGYFHQLRNRVTHRIPLNFAGHARYKNGKYVDFQYPFLPDDPDEITSTFIKELRVLDEAKKWLESIFSFINDVSSSLLSLFQTPSS